MRTQLIPIFSCEDFSHSTACGVLRGMAHGSYVPFLSSDNAAPRTGDYALSAARIERSRGCCGLVQDLVPYRASPPGERDVRPWLYAIASNVGLNPARDGARRARVIVADNEESTAADAIGKHPGSLHENEGYAAVHMREMISDLPTKQRQALHLRYFAGLDYAAMATAMGCSEESARVNVSQAMKKLKARW